jgi:CRP-like cAMP-binding protein
MALDVLVKPLLGLELLRGLQPTQIAEIARRAERITYRPGDPIIAQNEQGDAAIVIVSGEALRVSGPGLHGRPETVPTGALLGEMAMLIETEYSSTVVARTAVRALRLTRAGLHAQMADDVELAEHFVLAIAGRLRHIADELRAVETTLSGANSPDDRAGDPLQLPHVISVTRELAAGVQLLQ